MLSKVHQLERLQQKIIDYCPDNFVPQEPKQNTIKSIESFKQKK